MATIRQRVQVTGAENPVSDWGGLAHTIAWPAGLSERERVSLFRRGKKDARHGLVGINEYGEIASPYCETLVQAANQRIALEWLHCDEMSFDAQSHIEQIELQIKELNKKLKDVTVKRDEALSALERRHYDGDDVVSEHLFIRRKLNREKPVHDAFEQERNVINDRLTAAEMELIPYRYALSKAEETAMSNEQLARADYLWRLSVYAYGASNYIKITPDMINDSALSNEPREKHNKIFGAARANEVAEDNQ